MAGCDQIGQKTQDKNASAEAGSTASKVRQEAINEALAVSNFGEAASLARDAIAESPSVPELYLLLARAEARLNNMGNAVSALRRAFELGFHDPRGALNHPDFDGIRNGSEFARLAQKYAPRPTSQAKPASHAPDTETVRAGDVSITEHSDGSTRIRAGDVVIED